MGTRKRTPRYVKALIIYIQKIAQINTVFYSVVNAFNSYGTLFTNWLPGYRPI
jgi:hypothetical protein